MGYSSTYCALSNISICDGDKTVMLPIKKEFESEWNDSYLPATLPIIGYYSEDSRLIENVEKNKSTELIEEYFNMSIDDFIDIVVHHDNSNYEMEISDELKDLTYVYIDYNVYSLLNEIIFKRIDLGNHNLLKLLGFEKINETTFQKENMIFTSDGRTLKKDNYIIPSYERLKEYVSIDDEIIKKYPSNEYCYEIFKNDEIIITLFTLLKNNTTDFLFNKRMINYCKKKNIEPNQEYLIPINKVASDIYLPHFEEFIDELIRIKVLFNTLFILSKRLSPQHIYCPQDGEFKRQSELLKQFSNIAYEKENKFREN